MAAKERRERKDNRPAYFKTSVARRMKEEIPANDLHEFLLATLGEGSPGVATIVTWSHKQRAIVEDYAARVHLSASDNPVRVPRRPKCLGVVRSKEPKGTTGTLYDLIR
jgi:hypothetical protein